MARRRIGGVGAKLEGHSKIPWARGRMLECGVVCCMHGEYRLLWTC